jgi:flagellar operon protein
MAQEIRPVGTTNVKPIDAATYPAAQPAQKAKGQAFEEILKSRLSGVKFSSHALERLQRRNISLTPERMAKIDSAVAKAAEKGSRESLILMDDLALIVSIKNKTVITAVDGESIRENVFTNIDSAVIMR